MATTRATNHSSDNNSTTENLPPVRPRLRNRPSTQANSPSGADAADLATQKQGLGDGAAAFHSEDVGGERPYAIGYGKPPKDTQFKRDQSGNPRGRAKGSRNTRTIFEEESQKLVEVTESGKTRKLTKRELVLKTIINKAAKGDEKAQVKFLKLDERFSQSAAGSPGAPTPAGETMAELSAADQIILERYRAMLGGVPNNTPAGEPPTSETGSLAEASFLSVAVNRSKS